VTVILTLPACEVIAGDHVNVMLTPNHPPVRVIACAQVSPTETRLTLELPGAVPIRYHAPNDYPMEVHRTYH
jgi:hypothetical protein